MRMHDDSNHALDDDAGPVSMAVKDAVAHGAQRLQASPLPDASDVTYFGPTCKGKPPLNVCCAVCIAVAQ